MGRPALGGPLVDRAARGLLRLCEEHPILFVLLSRPGRRRRPATCASARAPSTRRASRRSSSAPSTERPRGASLNTCSARGTSRTQRADHRGEGARDPFYIEEWCGARRRRRGRVPRRTLSRDREDPLRGHPGHHPGGHHGARWTAGRCACGRFQTACVIGAAFHRDVLVAVAGDEGSLGGELEDLLNAEFSCPRTACPARSTGSSTR